MKKYISANLINVLLLQFVGCYSQREITYDEFYILPEKQEAEVIIIDGSTIELTSDSTKSNYMWWWKGQDTLTIYTTHLEKIWPTALIEVTDTIHFPKEEIAKLLVDEYDEVKTIIGVGIPVIFVTAMIIAFFTSDWMNLESW